TTLTMSARSRTASTSSCLIRPGTVRSPRVPRSATGPPLQEPALGKEQPFVLPERVPVGHPGDVVGHAGRQVAGRAGVLGRDRIRVFKVVPEERPDQLDGLLLLLGGLRTQVDAYEQEVPKAVE